MIPMIRAFVSIAGLLATIGACQPATAGDGGETEAGSTASSTAADGESTIAATDDTAGDTGPSGSCPLEGMFVECIVDGTEGVAYCDDIGGELQWGPCLPSVACELGQGLEGCQTCTLVDGVPTITGSPTCECAGPGGAPQCEQTECFARWDYSCGSCQSFTSGDCFSYSEGCSDPWLGCDLGSPCNRVWALSSAGEDVLDTIEDEEAAICVLTALRDGVPGTFRIEWGLMFDGGWPVEHVHSSGDGTVVVEWYFDCPGCQNYGTVGRSGVVSLQPASWFDDCLADPTTANLIACTVGLVEIPFGNPPREGYVPPFTTGECVSLDAVCP